MASIPPDLRYTTEHEWARLEGDGRVRTGITDFAQERMGDVVYLDLPAAGTAVVAGERMGEVESTKSVSDVFSPISGTVVEANATLDENPAAVNQDPYGEGWLVLLAPADGDQLGALLDADAYAEAVRSAEG